MNSECNGRFFKGHFYIHAVWIFFILVCTIICLLAVVSQSDMKLGQLIQTSAEISALLLAVIAIIYAFISNDSLLNQIGVLSEASRTINESATRIAMSTHDLQEHITTTTENIIDEVHKVSSEHGKSKTANQTDSPALSEALLDNETIKRFLQNSTGAGMVGLYAAYLASKTGKVLIFAEFLKVVMDTTAEYYWGYLACAKSLGLIQIKPFRIENVTTGLTIESINPLFSQKIIEEIESRKTMKPHANWMSKAIAATEKLFST